MTRKYERRPGARRPGRPVTNRTGAGLPIRTVTVRRAEKGDYLTVRMRGDDLLDCKPSRRVPKGSVLV